MTRIEQERLMRRILLGWYPKPRPPIPPPGCRYCGWHALMRGRIRCLEKLATMALRMRSDPLLIYLLKERAYWLAMQLNAMAGPPCSSAEWRQRWRCDPLRRLDRRRHRVGVKFVGVPPGAITPPPRAG